MERRRAPASLPDDEARGVAAAPAGSRRAALLGALAALLPAVARAQPDRPTVRIAVVVALAGRAAEAGESVVQGAELALGQARGDEGRPGPRVELITLDDQERPDVAVTHAKRLIASPDVLAVVGHLTAGVAVPASEVYREAGLPLITPAATGSLVTDRGLPGVSRVCGRHDIQGVVAAELTAAHFRARSVYVLHDRATEAQDAAELFRAEAERRGLRVLGLDAIDPRGDVERPVPALLAAAPDVVYGSGAPEAIGAVLRRVRDRGSKARFLGPDSLDSPELLRVAGPAAVGLHYTTVVGPAAAWPRPRPFVDDFRVRFGREPGVYAALAYDATAIALRAIEGAAGGGGPSREAVSAGIRRIRHAGVTGDVEFDARGDRRRALYFLHQVTATDPDRWSDNRMAGTRVASPRP